MKKLSWLIFVFVIAVSCLSEPDCYQLNNDTVVIYFRIVGGGSDLVQFTAHSPESDSIFYPDGTQSMIILPLNPKEEETLFTFQGPTGNRNLLLGYQRQVQFVSDDCGERYVFQHLSVLENEFDSVRLVNETPVPTPLPSNAKNIEIYRCAATNLMGISFTVSTHVEQITTDFATIVLPADGMLKDFILPVDQTDETDTASTYVFDFGAESKTLRVSYKRTEKTFADICGLQVLSSDLHVNPLITDMTVTLKNDSIQDLPVINLEITP